MQNYVRFFWNMLYITVVSLLKQLADEASRFHLGRQRQHSAVICSGALLFSSRVLRPSLVTLCSHTSGRSWTLPCVSSLVPSVLHLSHGFQCSPTLNRQPYKMVEKKFVKHDSWPYIQPDILNSPLLRLTSRKPLCVDLQPDDIKSRWMDNWKSAQVVNSHQCATPQSGNWVSTSLSNSGLR